TPTPEASPAPAPLAGTGYVIRADPEPYVCKSRRNFVKHVFRPYGTKLRIKATLDGRPLKSTITRRQILIRIDLRGERKDTYTLRVTISRTRDGKRITTTAVERIDYHTCIPTF